MSKFPFFKYRLITDTSKTGRQNQQYIDEFERFIEEYAQPIFSAVGLAKVNFKIGLIDIQSVIDTRSDEKKRKKEREGGKAARVLMRVAQTYNQQASNNSSYKKRHQQKSFLTILRNSNGNFRKLIRELELYLETLEITDYRWNAVYYGFFFGRW